MNKLFENVNNLFESDMNVINSLTEGVGAYGWNNLEWDSDWEDNYSEIVSSLLKEFCKPYIEGMFNKINSYDYSNLIGLTNKFFGIDISLKPESDGELFIYQLDYEFSTGNIYDKLNLTDSLERNAFLKEYDSENITLYFEFNCHNPEISELTSNLYNFEVDDEYKDEDGLIDEKMTDYFKSLSIDSNNVLIEFVRVTMSLGDSYPTLFAYADTNSSGGITKFIYSKEAEVLSSLLKKSKSRN